jgi:hypothetical protein
VALVCALLAATTVASGGTERQSDIPACEELLSGLEAKHAMGEPNARIESREVFFNTRRCGYVGGSAKKTLHSIALEWGPYSDVRRRWIQWDREFLCPVNKVACRKADAASKLRPHLRSFYALQKALEQVGHTKRLSGWGAVRPPAFLWLPGRALAPLDQMAWVFVYDVGSAHMLLVVCSDNSGGATSRSDAPCALSAARRTFENITP